MKLTLIAATFAVLLAPAAAFADDENAKCTDVAQASWLTVDAIKAKAEAAGYTDIKQVKIEGSCYEVYAHDKDGNKAEVLFNPATGDKAGDEAAE